MTTILVYTVLIPFRLGLLIYSMKQILNIFLVFSVPYILYARPIFCFQKSWLQRSSVGLLAGLSGWTLNKPTFRGPSSSSLSGLWNGWANQPKN